MMLGLNAAVSTIAISLSSPIILSLSVCVCPGLPGSAVVNKTQMKPPDYTQLTSNDGTSKTDGLYDDLSVAH